MHYRDMSVPYTAEEIKDLRVIFRSLPTYKDNHILTSDFPEIFHRLRYERSAEQVEAYKNYWNGLQDGKVYEEQYIDLMTNIYKTYLGAQVMVDIIDKNKSGFISEQEFTDLLHVAQTHDTKLAGKTFEDFVAEADSDKDGRVSIGECVKWIEKCTNEKGA